MSNIIRFIAPIKTKFILHIVQMTPSPSKQFAVQFLFTALSGEKVVLCSTEKLFSSCFDVQFA